MKLRFSTVFQQIKRLNIMYSKFGDLDSVSDETINKKAENYHEELKDFEEHIFIKACNQWINEGSDKMPTVAHLRLKCLKIAKEGSVEIVSSSYLGDLVCQCSDYFSQAGLELTKEESEYCFLPSVDYVKELIEFHGEGELKSLREEAAIFKTHYNGKFLCSFHRSLVKAKRNPDSWEASWCKSMLENYLKTKNFS